MSAEPAPKTTLQGGASPSARRPVVGVFARHPTPGATKTRLAAAVGEAVAAAVAEAMWATTLRRLEAVTPAERVLAVTPAEAVAWFRESEPVLCGRWSVVPQPGGDLGRRMRWFFEAAADGRPALLLGADSPHFAVEAVREGLEWLAGGGPRAVVGPADDGGYWAIGVAGPTPPVFDALPWGDAGLLTATVARLEGWRRAGEGDYCLLSGGYDIDTVEDLDRLRSDLRRTACPELRALRDRIDGLLGPGSARDLD